MLDIFINIRYEDRKLTSEINKMLIYTIGIFQIK